MSKNTYKEKRAFVRVPIETLVTFTINDHNEIPYRGTSQNLCARGLYITTNYAAKLDDQIRVILNTNEKNVQPLIAEGKVVRCKFDKKNTDLFHVSIAFTELHETWVQTIATSC